MVITKLNDFVINIKFIDNAGKKRVFSGKPVKIPFCRIIANGSRKVSFNFGKFDYSLNNWLTSQEYEFTYVHGAKF